jgi:hypothetical protein
MATSLATAVSLPTSVYAAEAELGAELFVLLPFPV